jgi:hypothetical protein
LRPPFGDAKMTEGESCNETPVVGRMADEAQGEPGVASSSLFEGNLEMSSHHGLRTKTTEAILGKVVWNVAEAGLQRPNRGKKETGRSSLWTIVAYLPFHLVVTALTWRDLKNRPDEQVWGNKRLWRWASALNTLGSVAYWLVGRKGSAAPK